ncbi:MAG TPA: endo alpha-1,4 polygalactosaminidase [Acidimicrobiales bacterium]|nr:endo alpha-1,4 polygalactosaminidase [Acidimicrobiales bacterium]
MSRTGGSVVAGIILLALVAVVPTPVAGASGPWVPAPGLRWQYQLQGTFKPNLCVVPSKGGACVRPNVYDLDLYATNGVTLNSAAVAAVHGAGGHAVCYVDAGTWENWRPDAHRYPVSVLGKGNGWPGERWVDIRNTSVLLPILSARVAKCAAAHFDAVEFDNVDGFANNTGFPLTGAEQLTFDEDLASMAHADGLSVGLKNDLAQLGPLQSAFDFAINEQCAQYNECADYAAWEAAHKAVVEVEYREKPAKFCLSAVLAGRDAMQKGLSLRAKPWKPCR